MTAKLRAALLAWYRRERRDLPWRRTRDPYAIWVSEIMLQQTQVDTVAPRWQRFLDEFPTVAALAAVAETRVCEAWAGLGYYRRARNLHRAARQVVAEHDGVVPRTAAALLELPGIGRYTAGAIASIAFGEAAPLVDGNVTRILCRLFALPGAPGDAALSRRLWQLAQELVQGEAPGDLNQALMELGATVCSLAAPACGRCPVVAMCRAHKDGNVLAYPARKPAAAPKALLITFAYVATARGVWLEQRPLEGLWAGLWELPSASGRGGAKALEERLGVSLGARIATVSHVLTHRKVTAHVHAVATRVKAPGTVRVHADPLSAPLSGLARKAIMAVGEED